MKNQGWLSLQNLQLFLMVEEILLQFLVFDCASVGYHQVAALDEMDVLALLFEVAPSGQNQQNHNYSDHAT